MSSPVISPDAEEGSKKFLLGLVEGFYGRPFTADQRKELFKKLKRFGHSAYVYAPKDDYKHRASWRELYTVEEGEHLQGLISAANESGIDFYYALSPGLDITYSSIKDTSSLKRKLDQVSQFGCQHFALLFDDIESEMTKSDKEVFQSFAHAQVSISNEIYNHLNRNQPNRPNFLFCPTQYCSTRAVPTVTESEYLNTIGQKLVPSIDILWTGSKVISKILTAEEIQEITEVLRRKPLIWDNLHANDYDPKRVFLGPYNGRSPELIPLLRGVLTNPNCEFHANTIAIHTLGQWSRCNAEVNSTISDTQKLETENDDDEENPPHFLSENIYHPRVALKNAILEWLPEFFQDKKAFGPIVKPHPTSAMAPIIPPIIPSINTCMTLTLTTPTISSTTTGSMMIPEVNTAQLHALADICSSVVGSTEIQTQSNVMNSLVSATKVVTTDIHLSNPILTSSISIPDKMPVSSVPIPISLNNSEIMEVEKTSHENNSEPELMDCGTPKHFSSISSTNSDLPPSDENHKDQMTKENGSPSRQIEIGQEPRNEKSPLSDDVVMSESLSNNSMQFETTPDDEKAEKLSIGYDDILLFADLFYLPFEHGKQGLQLLNEFQWLKINASVLCGKKGIITEDVEVEEWFRRSDKLLKLGDAIFLLTRKIASCVNRELCYDLFTYAWEISSVISIYIAYVKWLALGKFPSNSNSYTQGSYTWFSKGWKETFMSGDQEPWVFRGGLIADLQRLIPVDSGNDLFIYKLPETPTLNFYLIRPYSNQDEADVFRICHKTCRDGSDCSELFPENLQEIPADRLVAPFVTLTPEFCMVVENSKKTLVGYACAALDSKQFYRSQEVLWLPIMCEKYPLALLDTPDLSQASKDAINWFHNFKYDCPDSVLSLYPSIMTATILKDQIETDLSVCKRLICVLLAALRTNGSCGIHVVINRSDSYMQQFYGTLGFTEVYQDQLRTILGRTF